jgi:hypothetical protein
MMAVLAGSAAGQEPAAPAAAETRPLTTAFQAEIARIGLEARPLLGIDSSEAWKARRPILQRQLRDMLGLEPLPDRTDLKAEVRGSFEHDGVVVERILFQSMPGLYVTGNLYRAKDTPAGERRPGVLYVCGHSRVEKDGLICGNKAHYQHHGLAFARNGFVCLVIDTLQLGEIAGPHHGTYNLGQWWWQSRGYTPAGVETWNGMRALDYLASRPEVDPDRLGVTGRSGGGATSWWLGALDDRLRTVAPVAGITDLADHLVTPWANGTYPAGVIEGHCDCMYPVNTYRWDFDTLAALVAPRALLIANTDHDPIFPIGGVTRIYDQLVRVYGWYDAPHKVALVVGRGGHDDTDVLQAAVLDFFRETLGVTRDGPPVLPNALVKIPVERLRVLDPGETFADARNAEIQESFVPKAVAPPVPESAEAWTALKSTALDALGSKTFGGWPSKDQAPTITVRPLASREHDGAVIDAMYDLETWPGVSVFALTLRPGGAKPPAVTGQVVFVPDASDWRTTWAPLAEALRDGNEPSLAANPLYAKLRAMVEAGQAVALVVPRGVGPSAWPDKLDTHLRRRYALIGQTLDGMRAWDVMRALEAVRPASMAPSASLELVGQGESTTWVLWASVFTDRVTRVTLIDPPAKVRDGPAFLNLERTLDMPQAVALLAPREVAILSDTPDAWAWTRSLADRIGWSGLAVSRQAAAP